MFIKFLNLLLLSFLLIAVSGCGLIESIFKAGMWTAVVGIVLIVIVFIWIARAVSK